MIYINPGLFCAVRETCLEQVAQEAIYRDTMGNGEEYGCQNGYCRSGAPCRVAFVLVAATLAT